MRWVFLTYEREIYQILALSACLGWAITFTVLYLNTEKETVLVGFKDNSAFVLTEAPESDLLVQNFIERYLALCYNFSNQTFEANLNKATDLLSPGAFREVKPTLQKAFSALEGRNLVQSSQVFSIKKLGESKFQAKIKTWQLEKGREQTSEYQIRLSIRRIKRTYENPWGLEVTKHVENRI